jgi:hypothetical protein
MITAALPVAAASTPLLWPLLRVLDRASAAPGRRGPALGHAHPARPAAATAQPIDARHPVAAGA